MPTILVVDDRPTNRDVLTTLLDYDGHRVIEAGDGLEALEILRRDRPALVISDIAMPVMDGFEFVSEIRRDPLVAATPVIFYTAAFREQKARDLARSCGVEHVLVKPSDPQTIIELVRQVVGQEASGPGTHDAPGFARAHAQVVADKLVDKLAELEATNLRLSTLLEFGVEFAIERTPFQVLELAAESSRRLVGGSSAAVYLREEAARGCRLAAVSYSQPDGRTRLPWPQTISDPGQDAERLEPHLLSTPIPWAGRILGWLRIAGASDQSRPLQSERELIGGIASLLAMGYHNALHREAIEEHAADLERQVAERTAELSALAEKLAQQAIVDPLTGLYNRRYMVDLLEREFSRARRAGAKVALILADIDHFKQINDRSGHQAGDRVLQAVANSLSGTIRREDSVCRYGGEEFLIVLPGANGENALARADAFRRAVAELVFDQANSVIGPVTLSLGVSSFPDHGATPEEVLRVADRALYETKAAGRNCSRLGTRED